MFGQKEQTIDPYSEPEENVDFLQRMRADKEQYTDIVSDTEFVVYPEVFAPKHDGISCTDFFVKNMPSPYNKRVLDVGTGTGVLALISAIKGASLVHAIDINPHAIENARANFKKHNFGEDLCQAYQSDLFENVHTTFDLVLMNPPHQGFQAKDMLERSLTDENYSLLRRFFSEIGAYLTENGIACTSFSELGDLNLIEELIKKSSLVVEKIVEDQRKVTVFFIIMKKKM